MKRCPQCLFLYPDSDENCDFDQAQLEPVDESTVEAATRPRKRRVMPIAAAVALIVGVLVFAIYYGVSRQTQKASAAEQSSTVVVPAPSPSPTSPSQSPVPEPSPSPSPTSTAKPSPSTIATAHTRSTSDPVSTSGPGIGTRQGGKPVITLTSGGKIEADEVWRTKDGVWYRRKGMVTLLKRGQVKAIATR
jgi:cytoskeletal protein RodZ